MPRLLRVGPVCPLISFPIPDPSLGSSPADDVGILAEAGAGGEAGDAVAENGIGVDDGGYGPAGKRSRIGLPLRRKSFPYWSRNWQRVWTNYLSPRRRRSVFSAPKLCGGALAPAADNDAGSKRRRRERGLLVLLCHGKYCNNWRWQRPRSRGSAGASCRTGNEDTMELQSLWMLDLLQQDTSC